MITTERLRNIKLIVLDMDGTLLDDKGNIGRQTLEYVKILKSLGVKFSFATGRLNSTILNYAAQLELNEPLISLDGALIRSSSGTTVFESFVPERYVKKAVELADRLLLKVALCHVEAIYYTEYNVAVTSILDKFGAEFTEIPSYEGYMKNVLEVVIAGEESESIKYIKNRLEFPYSFGINATFFKSHFHPGIYYSEIRKKGVSKGSGLEKLVRFLKLKIGQTAVIGDWYNDRSLFETGALKIAMANAVPEIKRMADFITERSNNEDGTAEFLEMVLKAKKNP